jgi:glyoxylase-like metal-dependent hydrolase (beta-lactamase superfamily II)
MELHKNSFRFKLGNFECLVVSDGTLTVPTGHTLDIMCLLIRTGEHTVLIDTGFASAAKPDSGFLLKNLAAEGIHSDEIDTIILSHGHADHVGGNTDGKGNSLFPGARFVIAEIEMQFWTALMNKTQSARSVSPPMLEVASKNLPPIRDQLELVGDGAEIVPGIKMMMAPGHTPGHTVQIITSGDEQLFCIADLMHSPLEFTQPDVFQMFDVSHEQALKSRNQILSQNIRPDLLVFACHFSPPGLGHIVKKDNVYEWQPVETG